MKLKKLALIIDNRVREIVEAESLEGRYHPSFEFVDVTDQDVMEGMYFDRENDIFVTPLPESWYKWDSASKQWIDGRTDAEIQAGYNAAIQARLDGFARTRGYDGILSACSYATSTNAKFAAEGAFCVAARDNTWSAFHEIMAEAQAGRRQLSTAAELLAELPQLSWPL